MLLEFDSTPITAHSEKELAAGHYKGGFGFHALLVSCGREVLAGILRPGNAGDNSADDHLEALGMALEQLPREALNGEILARADSAGASHDFAFACRETDNRFSLGYAITKPVREALLALPKRAWKAAHNADGEPREGAWVAELTDRVNLGEWPQGTRLICRRERPHPGAQLSFTDLDGHRFQCFIYRLVTALTSISMSTGEAAGGHDDTYGFAHRRIRASRRGGHVLTRAQSPSTGLPVPV